MGCSSSVPVDPASSAGGADDADNRRNNKTSSPTASSSNGTSVRLSVRFCFCDRLLLLQSTLRCTVCVAVSYCPVRSTSCLRMYSTVRRQQPVRSTSRRLSFFLRDLLATSVLSFLLLVRWRGLFGVIIVGAVALVITVLLQYYCRCLLIVFRCTSSLELHGCTMASCCRAFRNHHQSSLLETGTLDDYYREREFVVCLLGDGLLMVDYL